MKIENILRAIHNWIMRNLAKPDKKNSCSLQGYPLNVIPAKRLNWNVDYFASINVSELKPQDVIVFRISDDVDLDQHSLKAAKDSLIKKAESYGIKNKVMVLYKVDIGVISP